jgi:hypothetical protein
MVQLSSHLVSLRRLQMVKHVVQSPHLSLLVDLRNQLKFLLHQQKSVLTLLLKALLMLNSLMKVLLETIKVKLLAQSLEKQIQKQFLLEKDKLSQNVVSQQMVKHLMHLRNQRQHMENLHLLFLQQKSDQIHLLSLLSLHVVLRSQHSQHKENSLMKALLIKFVDLKNQLQTMVQLLSHLVSLRSQQMVKLVVQSHQISLKLLKALLIKLVGQRNQPETMVQTLSSNLVSLNQLLWLQTVMSLALLNQSQIIILQMSLRML